MSGGERVRQGTLARRVPDGSLASQTATGNRDGLLFSGADAVGRCGTVMAGKRSALATAAPSTVTTGQVPAVTMRATAPPSPMTT